MEFRDLKGQYIALQPDLDAAIKAVLESGAFIMGQPVRDLESKLAQYVGVKHCLTCASGTDALTLSMMALGIKAGDAVFVPDFTFFATAEAVALVGAVPVFVDVRADSFNIDPVDLERKVKATAQKGHISPKAVIAVDLYGLPADYPSIRKIADKYNLTVIEDGAQGFGGQIEGRRSCSLGDISTTSFFPAKPLGCYGDGGAVFTDDDHLAEMVSSLRVHGKGAGKYDNVRIGLNSRLDTLQAAILGVKFDAFTATELDAVRKAASIYTEQLHDTVTVPVLPQGYASAWAQYTIRLSGRAQRDAVKAALQAAGIPSMVYYPKPLHLQEAFSGLTETDDCPVASRLCEEVLSIPIHPYLTRDDISRICMVIKSVFNNEPEKILGTSA